MIPLLAKDLREHGRALIAFSLLLLFMAWGMALDVEDDPGGTALVALRRFLMTGAFLAASYANHRLVAREYSEETQLFLEALPIARWRVVTAKLLLGLALTFAMISSSAAIQFLVNTAPLGAEIVAIALIRAIVFVLFLHALFFATSFLGRYRIPLVLMLVLAAFYVDMYTQLELDRIGPIDLISDTFTGETTELPASSLMLALTSALALYLIAYLLAHLGDGAVTAFLSQKMSQREKVFIAIVFVCALVASASAGDANKKEDFDLKDAIAEQRPGVLIKIAAGPNEAKLREFAIRLLEELSALREMLGIEHLPPLFISTRPDFEPRQIDVGDIGKAEGLMVRLRLPENQREREEITAAIVGGLLVNHTEYRLLLERRRWLIDGFTAWWVRRHTKFEDLSANRDYLLRALYAWSDPIALYDLERWLSLRDRSGDCSSSALAFSLLSVLAEQRGRGAMMAVVKALLLDVPPKDLRALFLEPSFDEVLRAHAGTTAQDLIGLWNAKLREHFDREAEKLEALPRLEGRLQIEALSEQTRRVGYRLLSPAPIEGPVRLLYLETGPFNVEIDAWEWRTEELPAARAREGAQLPETWSAGKRIAWTFAADVEELGCEVISGWKRETIE